MARRVYSLCWDGLSNRREIVQIGVAGPFAFFCADFQPDFFRARPANVEPCSLPRLPTAYDDARIHCGRLLDGCSFGPDRKSTRLNSSHLVISYAVFCLKKKILASLNTTSYHCSVVEIHF